MSDPHVPTIDYGRDAYDFSGGWYAREYLPAREVQAAATTVLEDHADIALQYGEKTGVPEFKCTIQGYLQREYGIETTLDQLAITTGAKQGLDLVCKLLLDPGDAVAVTSPTYGTGIALLESHGAELLEVAIDEDGMVVSDLAAKIEDRLAAGKDVPKLVYDMPEFHNPLGVTMSRERREQLIDLAETHDMMVVEDAPYRKLRFEGDSIPPIRALTNGAAVTYLGTYSKIVSPGIRVGWMVAAPEIIEKLPKVKPDGGTSPLNQLIVNELHASSFIDERTVAYAERLRIRRDATIDAIHTHLPEATIPQLPQGGYYLWLELPPNVDSSDLLEVAIDHDVVFFPSSEFYPTDGPANYLRLSYAYETPASIRQGIRALAAAFADYSPTTHH